MTLAGWAFLSVSALNAGSLISYVQEVLRDLQSTKAPQKEKFLAEFSEKVLRPCYGSGLYEQTQCWISGARQFCKNQPGPCPRLADHVIAMEAQQQQILTPYEQDKLQWLLPKNRSEQVRDWADEHFAAIYRAMHASQVAPQCDQASADLACLAHRFHNFCVQSLDEMAWSYPICITALVHIQSFHDELDAQAKEPQPPKAALQRRRKGGRK